MSATDVQIYTGPTATTLHHLAAWVQATFDVTAVSALGITLASLLIAFSALIAVGIGLHRLLCLRTPSGLPLYLSLSLFLKLRK